MVSETIALNEAWLSSSHLCCRQRVRHNMKAFCIESLWTIIHPITRFVNWFLTLLTPARSYRAVNRLLAAQFMIRSAGDFGCINTNAPRACRPAGQD